MKYLKPIALLFLVFVAGICVGVVGTRIVIKRTIRQAIRQPELVRLRVENNLARELALTPDQQQKLDDIFLNLQQDIARARAERQPRARFLLNDALRRFNEILTPEQQQKLEKLRAEYGVFSFGSASQPFPGLQRFRDQREKNQERNSANPP